MSPHRPPSSPQGAGQVSGPGGTADKPAPQLETPEVVDSERLLGGRATLLIRHQGEIYRLQTTRQGKLILTK